MHARTATIAIATLMAATLHADTPRHVYASVRLGGGSCSGTCIHQADGEATVLTAAHCTRSVGSEVRIEFVDGRVGHGRVIARDPSVDMALIVLPTTTDRVVAPVAEFEGGMPLTAVGYQGGVGPNFKRLAAGGEHKICQKGGPCLHRATYDVRESTVGPGDSGGGVFADGELVGVTSHMGGKKTLEASTHDQVVQFVAENRPEALPWLRPNIQLDPYPQPMIERPRQQERDEEAPAVRPQRTAGEQPTWLHVIAVIAGVLGLPKLPKFIRAVLRLFGVEVHKRTKPEAPPTAPPDAKAAE